jgi:uncharacterized protein (TIGR02300 family)
VVAKELGTKLTCQSCEVKFYDLNVRKPVCPKCDTEYVVAKIRGRRTVAKSEKIIEKVDKETPKTEKITGTSSSVSIQSEENQLPEDSLENIDMPEVSDVEEDNSTLIEDTSDMGDDDSDIAGVIVTKDSSAENN